MRGAHCHEPGTRYGLGRIAKQTQRSWWRPFSDPETSVQVSEQSIRVFCSSNRLRLSAASCRSLAPRFAITSHPLLASVMSMALKGLYPVAIASIGVESAVEIRVWSRKVHPPKIILRRKGAINVPKLPKPARPQAQSVALPSLISLQATDNKARSAVTLALCSLAARVLSSPSRRAQSSLPPAGMRDAFCFCSRVHV